MVLITRIFQRCNSLQSTSADLHNNPGRYKLPPFHKWGQSAEWMACPTSPCHAPEWSICRPRPRSLPPALSLSARCHSGQGSPTSSVTAFPRSFPTWRFSILCILLDLFHQSNWCLLYQLPWKLPTTTFQPSNPSAFGGSGRRPLVLRSENQTSSWSLNLLKWIIILFILLQLLHHKPRKSWLLGNFPTDVLKLEVGELLKFRELCFFWVPGYLFSSPEFPCNRQSNHPAICKYLLNSYGVPGTVPGSGNTSPNNTGKGMLSWNLHFSQQHARWWRAVSWETKFRG